MICLIKSFFKTMKTSAFKIGLSIAIFAAFVWWPVFNQPVLATNIKSPRLQLDQSVDRLSEIKDDLKISEAERLARELDARKEIIQKAINLSLAEIQNLKSRLEKLTIEETQKEAYLFKAASLIYLQEVENYLIEAKTELIEINQLEGIKSLASQLKEHRETAYDSRAQNIINFLLGFQIDELIASAENRWQKIQNDLKRLERIKLIQETGEFSVLMNQAQKYINEAASLNQKARQINVGAQQQATEQKEEAKNAIMPLVVDNDAERNSEARNLIESSLVNLRASYKIFIQISREVRKTLRF